MGKITDEQLLTLVARFAERREAGEPLDPMAYLAAHPEGGARLAQALESLLAAEALIGDPLPRTPEQLGPYRVLGELGQGGAGRVLKVEHGDRPGQPLALKLLHLTLQAQPRALERFRREAAALGRLDVPGVVRIIDAGLIDERPFIAMELIAGSSLAQLLARDATAFAPLEAARLVEQLARTVAAAHAAGVLHRDLNPRNVLLRPDGSPVLIDFGLVHDEDAPTLTSSGDILGTPRSMAPEQARGELVDERCDVFGLGLILYELLLGRPPRDPGDSLSVLRVAGARPLAPLVGRVAGVPRELATIVCRATSHRAQRRYPGAAELAEDLGRFLAGHAIHARPAGLIERAERGWLLHGRTLSFSAAGVLLALCAWVFARDTVAEVEARVRELHQDIAVAWLDGDGAVPAGLVGKIAEVAPHDPLLPHLRELGRRARQPRSDGEGQPGPGLPASGGSPPTGSQPAPSSPLLEALARGEELLRAGRPGEAWTAFDLANNLAPETPEILAARALAAWQAGEIERARGAFEQLARYLPGSSVLHRTLARIYLKQELYQDAQRAAAAAAALAPDSPLPRLLKARARAGLGDLPGMDLALDEAAARGADTAELHAELAALAAARGQG